jgi:hypothetical protein
VETDRPAVTVLFVDDMANIRELYELYFRLMGLRVISAGANTYVQKPCVPEDLLREVLRILSEPIRRSDAH